MKKFINLNELKLERDQMNGIVGGSVEIIVVNGKITSPISPVARYAVPLYGIKPVAFPRYAIADIR